MTTQQTSLHMHYMHHVTTEVLPKIVLVQKFYQRDASLFKNALFDGWYKFVGSFYECSVITLYIIFWQYRVLFYFKIQIAASWVCSLALPSKVSIQVYNCKAHSNDGMNSIVPASPKILMEGSCLSCIMWSTTHHTPSHQPCTFAHCNYTPCNISCPYTWSCNNHHEWTVKYIDPFCLIKMTGEQDSSKVMGIDYASFSVSK